MGKEAVELIVIEQDKNNVAFCFDYNGLKNLNKKIVRFAWKEVRIEKIT